MDKYLVRGAATALVLLILKDRPSYGYQIVQDIKTRSKELFDFGEGTVYPLLYSLESDGLIKGQWERGSGARRRRVYRLTPKGTKELSRRLAAWTQYERAMRTVLRGATN